MKKVKIGEVVSKVETWTPRIKAPTSKIKYIDIGAIDPNNKRIENHKEILGADAPSRARQLVASKDVIVSTVRPNLNAVGLVSDEYDNATASTGFCVLRPICDLVNPNYLFNWIKSKDFIREMIRQSTGQSYPAVSDKIIKSSFIPLPPLTEQKRIAAILDQASDLVNLTQKAFDKLNTLGQSIFHEMLNTHSNITEQKLCNIAELINGDRSSKYPSGTDLVPSGILFVGTKNIQDKQLKLEHCQFITKEKFNSLSRGKLRRGDIMMTLRGTLGQAAIFDCEYDTGFINAQLIIIRPKAGISGKYLLDYLSHPRTQYQMKRGESGSAVKQLTAKSIGELKVLLPEFEAQEEYQTNIEKLENQKTSDLYRKNKLDQLFKSLEQKAFRGEL